MSFFIRKKTVKSKPENKKRKRLVKGPQTKETLAKPRPAKKTKLDEEILSDSEIDSEEEVKENAELESSGEEEETAQEKRLRLAKQYLAQVEAEEAEKKEDEEITKDAISDRLKRDLLEQTGRLYKEIAHEFQPPDPPKDIQILKGHKLPVTCVVIMPDEKHIFTGSKDCSIIKWNIESGKKVHTIRRRGKEKGNSQVGHSGHVFCLAVSTDGKYLVSGDASKVIHVWDPTSCNHLHTFKGHRGAISGLTFRKGSHQLFSASHDRSIKVWNVDERAYIETLFGHHDAITGIDCLARERAVTSGGRDNSIRVWKIVEESQLVFNGLGESIDCVSLIDEEHFVSGTDENSLSLWGVMKKKPLVTVKNAHKGPNEDEDAVTKEHWITSIASLQHTNLVASGSKDGCICLWEIGKNFKSLSKLWSIPVVGFVNSMKFSSDGTFLVAAVGQEHRLGRWWRMTTATNSVLVIKLPRIANSR